MSTVEYFTNSEELKQLKKSVMKYYKPDLLSSSGQQKQFMWWKWIGKKKMQTNRNISV